MSPEELEARLEAVREKRGYLLPHHGLLALTAPKLLSAYDAAYTALALDDRTLSHHDREFVWLAILIATKEAIATHHIAKFNAAGGTTDAVEALLSIVAFVSGFRAYGFVAEHWSAQLPDLDPQAAWRDALARLGGATEPRLVHLAAASVQTANGDWTGLAFALRAAYAANVPEADLAEALSLTMFPASVPYYVEAAKVWRALIIAGELDASPPFQAWAKLSGQEGFAG